MSDHLFDYLKGELCLLTTAQRELQKAMKASKERMRHKENMQAMLTKEREKKVGGWRT